MRILSLLQQQTRFYSICRFPPIEILVDESKDKCAKSVRQSHDVKFHSARYFLGFPGLQHSTTKEYAGRKLVGYSMEQMFDVVADVEHYHTFLPFCKKSHVKSRTEKHLVADLVIGFPPVIEKYTSNVTLVKPSLIQAICTEGKLFNHLTTTWKFSPGLKNNLQTCIIDFFVSFDFRSPLHSQLAHMFFNELVRQMEGAFYQEASVRYGNPSIKTQHLSIVKDKNS